MIDDAQAEKAADFLRENARRAGELRGERIKMEEMRKSVKAMLFAHAPDGPVQSKESWAYAHPTYLEHLDKMREAIVADEENRALREGACMRIECWRTIMANIRGKL